MSLGKQFESELCTKINQVFLESDIRAVAYRHFEYKMNEQLFDIFVDTRGVEFYLAIECKSMDYSKNKSINFRHAFHTIDEDGQIPREDHFLWQSGRAGIIALELRNYNANKKIMVLLGWPAIYKPWKEGKKSIDLKDLSSYHTVIRRGGEWQLTLEDLLSVNYLNKKVEPSKKALRARLAAQIRAKKE
jgi:hypothetical protein